MCNCCYNTRKKCLWPYVDLLIRSLYYITNRITLDDYETNEDFRNYENSIVCDFSFDMVKFRKYVEDICQSDNSFGAMVMNQFQQGYYLKRNFKQIKQYSR